MFILFGGAHRLFQILICTIALFQFGCATVTPIPDGTRTLREVAHVLSRQEILTGNIQASRDNRGREPIQWPWLYEVLLKRGIKNEQIVDGSVVLGRTQYYWHNVTSGIVRQHVLPATVAKGLEITVGNIVEVEIMGGYATVVRVRYKNLADGQCGYRVGDRGSVGSTLDAINPIGGPGATSLYCPEIEKEGWFAIKNVMGIEWFSKPLQANPSP